MPASSRAWTARWIVHGFDRTLPGPGPARHHAHEYVEIDDHAATPRRYRRGREHARRLRGDLERGRPMLQPAIGPDLAFAASSRRQHRRRRGQRASPTSTCRQDLEQSFRSIAASSATTRPRPPPRPRASPPSSTPTSTSRSGATPRSTASRGQPGRRRLTTSTPDVSPSSTSTWPGRATIRAWVSHRASGPRSTRAGFRRRGGAPRGRGAARGRPSSWRCSAATALLAEIPSRLAAMKEEFRRR